MYRNRYRREYYHLIRNESLCQLWALSKRIHFRNVTQEREEAMCKITKSFLEELKVIGYIESLGKKVGFLNQYLYWHRNQADALDR